MDALQEITATAAPGRMLMNKNQTYGRGWPSRTPIVTMNQHESMLQFNTSSCGRLSWLNMSLKELWTFSTNERPFLCGEHDRMAPLLPGDHHPVLTITQSKALVAIYERLELNKLRTAEFLELFDRFWANFVKVS